MALQHIRESERGYSLVETIVVAALSMTLMSMTVVQISTSRASMNADNGMRLVLNELGRPATWPSSSAASSASRS